MWSILNESKCRRVVTDFCGCVCRLGIIYSPSNFTFFGDKPLHVIFLPYQSHNLSYLWWLYLYKYKTSKIQVQNISISHRVNNSESYLLYYISTKLKHICLGLVRWWLRNTFSSSETCFILDRSVFWIGPTTKLLEEEAWPQCAVQVGQLIMYYTPEKVLPFF